MSPTYTVARDQERRTPPWLYCVACGLLGVAECRLDACASFENALCAKYYNEEEDGLTQPWLDRTFVNPPFSLMPQIVDKALSELRDRGVRSCLVGPAGCSQRWFHKLWPWATIYLPDRRLVFLDRDGQLTKGAMQDTVVYLITDEYPHPRPDVYVLHVEPSEVM